MIMVIRATRKKLERQAPLGCARPFALSTLLVMALLSSDPSWATGPISQPTSVNSPAAAVAGPPALPDIDPLKRVPPVLKSDISFQADARPAADKISPTLQDRMASARAGAVIDVIVTLHEPTLDTVISPGIRAYDELRARHIAVLEHAFAAEAAPHGFDTKRGLKHSPVVAGRIAVDSIEALARLSMVKAIELDHRENLTRIEGGALIRASQLQGQGGQGNGIGVAVLDSGIDWTHPELASQVTAAGDFTGTQTSDFGFDDQGHGTSCAGIIAGNQDGMAPQAHLWAMKVCTADGCSQSDMEAALDAVYEYRNDYGGAHVVNMSIGGGAPINYVCDADYPSWTAVLGQLVGAGIAVFASSGNDGCTNGISRPACISHAISVGAVYDADIGSASFGPGACTPAGCSNATTAADMITCYSNSGTYLDILAPSHCADTTELGGGYDPCFGGTSAAAPYASGVAAQILSLRPSTTPAQLRQALASTGTPLTDPGNGITRNRIDAVSAYQYLTGGGGGGGGGGSALISGVPVSGDVDLGEWDRYTITVPTGATRLDVATSGTSADIDLYLRYGAAPTLEDWDYRPFTTSGNETITVTPASSPQSLVGGTWHVGVYGYQASAYSLVATVTGGGGSCTDDLQHGVVCLRDGRFEFQMTWTGFDGVTQPVVFVRQSDQTAAGVFQNNLSDITLVVKVTNGCSFNNHHWVWLGGFTNAAWRLEVTDTETGRSHVYTKALSSTPPTTVKDEASFPCP